MSKLNWPTRFLFVAVVSIDCACLGQIVGRQMAVFGLQLQLLLPPWLPLSRRTSELKGIDLGTAESATVLALATDKQDRTQSDGEESGRQADTNCFQLIGPISMDNL